MADNTFTSAILASSDVNTYLNHTGGAWVSWTPVVTQGGSTPTISNTRSRRWRAGRLIVVEFNLAITSAGSAGNEVEMTIPITAASSTFAVGIGEFYDLSGTAKYPVQIYLADTTHVDFRLMTAGAAADNRLGKLTYTGALANGDLLGGTFMYESATG